MNGFFSEAAPDLHQGSILIVDDVPNNLLLLTKLIGPSYRVTGAGSGEEAISALALTSFDLILLDIMMPGMDGFETLKRLRTMPNFGNTPVIFVTASQDEAMQLAGLALGADDYVTKPFVVDNIKLRIANALQRSKLQKQLALALDGAELGLWEWDACSETVCIDPRQGVPLDLSAAAGATASTWEHFVHPNCLPGLQRALAAVTCGSTAHVDLDVRLKRRFGEWLWCHLHGKVAAVSQGGQVTRLMGTYRNIEHRKRVEEAQKISEERLSLVMEATQEGVWDWQMDANTIVHNSSWCRILGLDTRYLEHDFAFLKSLIHPDDLERVEQALKSAIAERRAYACQYRLRRADGEYVWVLDRGQLVDWSSSGVPHRMVGSIKDITAEKQAEAEIHQLAFYDFLTGLPNRRLLMDRLEQQILSNARTLSLSALLFLDLDRFKELNDTLGHDAGDALLVEVGKRLRRCVRSSDTVARLGGDEFVVMLGNLGQDAEAAAFNARKIGQKILLELNAPYQLGEATYFSTPSMGLAQFSGAPARVDTVLKRADDAMYRAKAAGRNCLRIADESPSEAADGTGGTVRTPAFETALNGNGKVPGKFA